MTEPTQPLAPETAPTPQASGAATRGWWRPPAIDWRSKARWFGAEYLIVVLGVLTAVGINAWWGDRQDRAREGVYLRQLAADLRETERAANEVDAQMHRYERAPRRLAQAYYLADPPPRDSLVAWGLSIFPYRTLRPVLGTAEALVSTGDLALVRDDSLRIAISAYLDGTRGGMASIIAHDDQLRRLTSELALAVNTAPILAEGFSLLYPEMSTPAALDSPDRAAGGGFGEVLLVPPGAAVRPVDWDALLRDEQVHRLLSAIVYARTATRFYRDEIRQRSSDLRERVEAEIEP